MPSRFTIVFVLSVLGALHAWTGWRILPALGVDVAWQSAGTVLLVLSFFLMIWSMAAYSNCWNTQRRWHNYARVMVPILSLAIMSIIPTRWPGWRKCGDLV